MDTVESIYNLIGENDFNQDVSGWLSTGLLPLDRAISGTYVGGGFPIGRLTEVYGAPSCGKTMLATMAMIETQKKGGLAVFLDHEHAFSLSRGKKLGLSDDRAKWVYKQPNTAEESFEIIESIGNIVAKNDEKYCCTIVLDSIASMLTKAELETDFGDENMKTRLSLPVVMSGALKKISSVINKTNITLIMLNQTRDNPGVIYGEKEKTPGGNATKFYASVRIRLEKRGKEKDGDEVVGERILARVVKNKVYEPFKEAEYISNFKVGADLALTHIDFLESREMLGKSKGWVEFGGKKFRRSELARMCNENESVYNELINMIKSLED